jgi:cytochrome d ubiquinol oxidase subunit I
MEAGWIVTEVGRQPWVVYGELRTADAVTTAGGIWWWFAAIVVLYVAVIGTGVAVIRSMARRWKGERDPGDDDDAGPYTLRSTAGTPS